jgi:hypothetical protein
MHYEERGNPFPATQDRPRLWLMGPPCPTCESTKTRVICRIESAFYVRCDTCGQGWGVPPHTEPE